MVAKQDELTQLHADFDALRSDLSQLAESLKTLTAEDAQAGIDAAKAQAKQAQTRAGKRRKAWSVKSKNAPSPA